MWGKHPGKEPDVSKDKDPEMTSTSEGTQTNEVVGEDAPPRSKTMTTLGYSEASRIENTAEQQEAERKALEKEKR